MSGAQVLGKPQPAGINANLITPGPWVEPSSGHPNPAFFELIKALWARTGGSTTVVGPGGSFGIPALVAELSATNTLVLEAMSLGEFGLMTGDGEEASLDAAVLAQDASALAVAIEEAPPPGPEQGALYALALGDDGGAGGVSAEVLHDRLTVGLTGPFSASQQFVLAPAPTATVFPSVALPTGSLAQCTVASTGAVVFYLVQNLPLFLASGAPAGAIARINFAAGVNTGTVTWLGSVTVSAGGVLALVMPASADASFAGVVLIFVGDPA
jgi:hypothetical protein